MSQALEQPEMTDDHHLLRINQLFGFNPLAFPICTRTPKRNDTHSVWVGHVPFAMGLMEMAKPRTFVELGTHWGASYCTFCQAVKEMRLDTRCYAVDTWAGDPHAYFYGTEVLNDLRKHHDVEYSLFSELVQSTFDDALERFPDGSVDLLHIDGFHTYEAVRHDYETWLPKMSGRGIILFHDIEVRDRLDFGVWRFWDEIKQKYPHFEFYHSFGLGVLAVGESIPAGFQPMLGAPKAEADRIRTYFENLGEHLTAFFNNSRQKSNLQELLNATRDQLNAKGEELERLAAQYGRYRYHVADKVVNRIKKYPRTCSLIRSAGRGALALKRRVGNLRSRPA